MVKVLNFEETKKLLYEKFVAFNQGKPWGEQIKPPVQEFGIFLILDLYGKHLNRLAEADPELVINPRSLPPYFVNNPFLMRGRGMKSAKTIISWRKWLEQVGLIRKQVFRGSKADYILHFNVDFLVVNAAPYVVETDFSQSPVNQPFSYSIKEELGSKLNHSSSNLRYKSTVENRSVENHKTEQGTGKEKEEEKPRPAADFNIAKVTKFISNWKANREQTSPLPSVKKVDPLKQLWLIVEIIWNVTRAELYKSKALTNSEIEKGKALLYEHMIHESPDDPLIWERKQKEYSERVKRNASYIRWLKTSGKNPHAFAIVPSRYFALDSKHGFNQTREPYLTARFRKAERQLSHEHGLRKIFRKIALDYENPDMEIALSELFIHAHQEASKLPKVYKKWFQLEIKELNKGMAVLDKWKKFNFQLCPSPAGRRKLDPAELEAKALAVEWYNLSNNVYGKKSAEAYYEIYKEKAEGKGVLAMFRGYAKALGVPEHARRQRSSSSVRT